MLPLTQNSKNACAARACLLLETQRTRSPDDFEAKVATQWPNLANPNVQFRARDTLSCKKSIQENVDSSLLKPTQKGFFRDSINQAKQLRFTSVTAEDRLAR